MAEPFDPSSPPPAPPAPQAVQEGVELIPGVRVAESAMRFQYARSSGPGGQNVNKVNTKAELWVVLTAITGLTPAAMQRLRRLAGRRVTSAGEIHIAADVERTQERNRGAVLDRLRQMLEEAKREPKVRRKTKPSKAARQRRLESKRRRSDVKSGRRSKPADW